MSINLFPLEEILSRRVEKDRTLNVFSLDYFSLCQKAFLSNQNIPSTQTILRDGFLSIEKYLDSNPRNENYVYPILFKNFTKHNLDNQLFYQIKLNHTAFKKINSLLILLETCQINLKFEQIINAIKKNRHYLKSNSDVKIYFLLSDLNIEPLVYLELKRILNLHFNSPVERIDMVDLQKLSNLSSWAVLDLFEMQFTSDNFITHFCLSKQAQYYCPQLNLNVTEKFIISPYHSIEIGKF